MMPFADGKGEVETAEGGRALLEPCDDAQGMEVVVEAEAVGLEGAVESFLGRRGRRVGGRCRGPGRGLLPALR